MPYQLRAVYGVQFDGGGEEVTVKRFYIQGNAPRLVYMEGRQMQE